MQSRAGAELAQAMPRQRKRRMKCNVRIISNKREQYKTIFGFLSVISIFSESQEVQRAAIRDMVIPNNGLQGVLCDLCASAREKHAKQQTSIRQSSRRDAENAEGFGSQIPILLAAPFKCVRTGNLCKHSAGESDNSWDKLCALRQLVSIRIA